MAVEVKIPAMGESVSEAVIGRWMKQDGEAVAANEAILELESDKANMELAADQAGVLKILRAAGETVKEGDVVGLIEKAGQSAVAAVAATPPPGEAPTSRAPAAARADAPSGAKPAPAAAVKPARPVRTIGREATPRDAGAAADGDHPLSPAVRRIVTEENLDVAALAGSGPGGRLTKGDVLEAARQVKVGVAAAGRSAPAIETAATASPSRPAAIGRQTADAEPMADGEERVPMTRLRQVIARRLVEAQQTAAILTTFNEVDMSAVQELRARYKETFQKRHGVALGFMSFFVKACCQALGEAPEMNAEIRGTDIVYKRHVHMGIAVGTDRGLVVPVVRHADRLGFAEIEGEIVRLAELARVNRLSVDDLSGATFTISNGGIYGSLLSTPILNPPQSGILGMHKIEKRPVVVDDQIVVRPMMYLAVSYDHRIIDGKGAVTFLVKVKERLEDPTRLLLGL
jgi:2-oxoglutarate dehydrogenase E2 component (dihydrolipoamide succinyltransferase)